MAEMRRRRENFGNMNLEIIDFVIFRVVYLTIPSRQGGMSVGRRTAGGRTQTYKSNIRGPTERVDFGFLALSIDLLLVPY